MWDIPAYVESFNHRCSSSFSNIWAFLPVVLDFFLIKVKGIANLSILPWRKVTLSSGWKEKNCSESCDRGSQVASKYGSCFHLTNISRSIPVGVLRMAMMSSGSTTHSIAAERMGGSSCVWCDGGTIFFSWETWKTGWITLLGRSLRW